MTGSYPPFTIVQRGTWQFSHHCRHMIQRHRLFHHTCVSPSQPSILMHQWGSTSGEHWSRVAMIFLSSLQTYDSEASPPSPCLCKSGATLYSNAPTVLCGSTSGEHWSHVARPNCSVIVSASTATSLLHPLVIMHTLHKYNKYICCTPSLRVYARLPQCWMPRYRYVKLALVAINLS